MNTKKILAITTITLTAAGLASAQSLSPQNTQESIGQKIIQNFTKGFHKGRPHGFGNRKVITDAILSGNFDTFQTVASTSPLKAIDQTTFNLLTAQYNARKTAEDQIRSILTNAGIKVPPKN